MLETSTENSSVVAYKEEKPRRNSKVLKHTKLPKNLYVLILANPQLFQWMNILFLQQATEG